MDDSEDGPRRDAEELLGAEAEEGLGAKVSQAGVATPTELKAIVADTSLGRYMDETAEDYIVANATHKAALDRTNPAMQKLLARLGPLANRVEVLQMSRKNRERARTFLGGTLLTDEKDQEAIQRLKNRLGIDRIREKYRTTTRIMAVFTGQHHLLLASEHIGDALRYAEDEQFTQQGLEFSYNAIDGDRWAKTIIDCAVGEFTGIYAAALKYQGIAAKRADETRALREQRAARRQQLAGTVANPSGLVPGLAIITTQPEADIPEAQSGDTTTVDKADTPEAQSGDTTTVDTHLVQETVVPGAANDAVVEELAMAARSPVSPETILDGMSDEALTMMLLRRHNPTITDGRYALLDITVADGQVTFKGRLV